MSTQLKIGDKAPSFNLKGSDSASTSLEGYGGKLLVLYFFPKSDTSGCTQESIDFSKLKPAFQAANTEILGVSGDPVKMQDKFKAKYDLSFDLASDEGQDMLKIYGVWVEKSMYGKRYMGIERTTILIDPAGKIAQIWSKVKVPDHAQEVLKAAQTAFSPG